MVVDISTVAPIIIFIASLFVLYRLLKTGKIWEMTWQKQREEKQILKELCQIHNLGLDILNIY